LKNEIYRISQLQEFPALEQYTAQIKIELECTNLPSALIQIISSYEIVEAQRDVRSWTYNDINKFFEATCGVFYKQIFSNFMLTGLQFTALDPDLLGVDQTIKAKVLDLQLKSMSYITDMEELAEMEFLPAPGSSNRELVMDITSPPVPVFTELVMDITSSPAPVFTTISVSTTQSTMEKQAPKKTKKTIKETKNGSRSKRHKHGATPTLCLQKETKSIKRC